MSISKRHAESEFDPLDGPTGDSPLPLPRFGAAGATAAVDLPLSRKQALAGGVQPGPLGLTWEDTNLALRVDFMEVPGSEGPEIWAYVTGRPEQEGQAVVVCLQADRKLKFLQRTVTLVHGEDHTSLGRVSFGSLTEIAAKLGERVSADAFLLESPTPARSALLEQA